LNKGILSSSVLRKSPVKPLLELQNKKDGLFGNVFFVLPQENRVHCAAKIVFDLKQNNRSFFAFNACVEFCHTCLKKTQEKKRGSRK
jgi:hypothetical protein